MGSFHLGDDMEEQFWECVQCRLGDGNCVLMGDKNGNDPEYCIIGGSASWYKTDDYEIVEIKPDPSKSHIEMVTASENALFDAKCMCKPPKPEPDTPNCALCRWATKGTVNNGIFRSEKVFCKAQALKYADDVYGNDNCISLYERNDQTPTEDGDK